MLTVGSLFAGIGGFDLGFERAGMRTLWQVEQSEFCRRVLAKHFPEAHRFNDVRDVTGDPQRWAEHGGTLLEYVDVLCGGFPCQDISVAGRGEGIEGERSGLWSEYARLIGELRPRYVVVENVSALLVRGLGRVLGDLAAIGYDAEWDCIPASAIGAPHRRDRIWIVAHTCGDDGRPRGARRSVAGGPGQPESVRALQVAHTDDAGCGERRGAEPIPAQLASAERGSQGVADPERSGLQGRTRGGEPREGWASSLATWRDQGLRGQWLAEPDVGRVANGVPQRVDRLRALGNALVPQIAQWIGERIIEWEEGEVAA